MHESGILMRISSLPGSYGIGTMGREAYRFVDFLEAAGRSCRQILPRHPVYRKPDLAGQRGLCQRKTGAADP